MNISINSEEKHNEILFDFESELSFIYAFLQ